ncbi:MAG: hypothetical protein IPP57_08515 [Candidatus Obscuribacter sp.]|jgi:hypothetical protein|nr:hypothetical protein [Candidatus Obscuribacter sp.]MBK7840094.1 hypothetical protein [Candidatus Obscuribacter sp.]MBK9770849.1 hypothetical protein [Candidatus Obscuribacter sp.]
MTNNQFVYTLDGRYEAIIGGVSVELLQAECESPAKGWLMTIEGEYVDQVFPSREAAAKAADGLVANLLDADD